MWVLDKPGSEDEEVFFALIKKLLKRSQRVGSPRSPTTSRASRRDHHPGVIAFRDGEEGHAVVSAINVNDSVTKSEIRQSLWLP